MLWRNVFFYTGILIHLIKKGKMNVFYNGIYLLKNHTIRLR